ncbi:adenine nucleotide alpha hydrolase [Hymenobacter aerilatus]|uniref:Adenine nucleotide alpha hydrolase n=1 Tax=Hymenobacter aerilatus TaxID=2932251 RepID=A0A8T9SWA5_9BACT|nr:adenine nucleotide alpha hydrolase [Hymenobacter aerilatus]UOR06017.1 adenine nucleotide alpha hydrolase [Hymenobacter aerilatus]
MALVTTMSWSGGKDSALALYYLLRDNRYQVAHLLTNVNAHYDRVSMHGVRVELLEAQARCLALPLHQVCLPEAPSMAEYEQHTQAALQELQAEGATHVAFGDIFLEDLRAYREQQLTQLALQAVFPLWQRPTLELLREYLTLGFRAVVVCVNEAYLDCSFCGRLLDEDFLRDLPAGVDPCGENGEYHTFLFDAPYFQQPITFQRGDIVRRTYPAPVSEAPLSAFWYCDILLNEE